MERSWPLLARIVLALRSHGRVTDRPSAPPPWGPCGVLSLPPPPPRGGGGGGRGAGGGRVPQGAMERSWPLLARIVLALRSHGRVTDRPSAELSAGAVPPQPGGR